MKNPFVFGVEVSGEQFTDRKEEINEMKSDLLSGQSIIIYSPRRYGKTSLVKRVLEELKNDAVTAYIDVYPITSKEKLAEAIASKVTTSAFTSIKYDAAEIEFSIKGKEKDRERIFSESMDVAQKIAQKKNKRVIIAFDEFQETRRLDGEEIERVMRSHFQGHKDVSYIFIGSKKHMIEDIFENKNKPFFRFGKHISLKKIPGDEFSNFIKNKFRDSEIEISDEAVNTILDLTQSHPHYTQQLCHELWYITITKGIKKVDADGINGAVEKVLINQNDAYLSIWDAATKTEEATLIALASDEISLYSREVIEEYDLISQSHVQRSLKGLERKEVIGEANGKYEMDVFFKEWIKKRLLRTKI
ncbi:MAG: hypothetical protein A7316_04320 [Candidatus Altiarchaeales archaeon WOR_SM1_86-2]|nr:MAG: hypothetical protein A7316_04320 [Candidatus Altiarchaeales archaeon WOR_SM1_86-2]